MAAMIGFYLIVLIITGFRRLVYRLEIIYTRVIWYKWLFWLCELVMLPALFNVVWLGNCQFYSQRSAITLANCEKDIKPYPQILKALISLAFLISTCYNVALLWTIQAAKIST
jgi:hypothetical protein